MKESNSRTVPFRYSSPLFNFSMGGCYWMFHSFEVNWMSLILEARMDLRGMVCRWPRAILVAGFRSIRVGRPFESRETAGRKQVSVTSIVIWISSVLIRCINH